MAGFQTAHIVFFSGTGGTARFAAHLRDALAARGTGVTVTELGPTPAPPVAADMLVLLYPVYAANAPQPIGEWIAAAPEGCGTRTAVVSVSGGGEMSPNTACRARTIRQLTRRGYAVRYERMAVMPANFITPYGDALAARLLRAAPVLAARIAEDLQAGVTRRTRPTVWDRLLSGLFLLEHAGSGIFGRGLHAGDACNGCGLCARRCPRGNIAMRNGKPVFGKKCVICLRCVYACPQKAIKAKYGQFAVLKDGFDLDAVEARMAGVDMLPPVEGLTKGWALSGVRKYLAELDRP
jgi:ferredoxin/flavodoxin